MLASNLLARALGSLPVEKLDPDSRPSARNIFPLDVSDPAGKDSFTGQSLVSALASAELLGKAATQKLDGSSQSKLLVATCLWILLGDHSCSSTESVSDKTPVEPRTRSGVYKDVRMRLWLRPRCTCKPGLGLRTDRNCTLSGSCHRCSTSARQW